MSLPEKEFLVVWGGDCRDWRVSRESPVRFWAACRRDGRAKLPSASSIIAFLFFNLVRILASGRCSERRSRSPRWRSEKDAASPLSCRKRRMLSTLNEDEPLIGLLSGIGSGES